MKNVEVGHSSSADYLNVDSMQIRDEIDKNLFWCITALEKLAWKLILW